MKRMPTPQRPSPFHGGHRASDAHQDSDKPSSHQQTFQGPETRNVIAHGHMEELLCFPDAASSCSPSHSSRAKGAAMRRGGHGSRETNPRIRHA